MDDRTMYCPYCMQFLPPACSNSRICPKCRRDAGRYVSPPRHLPAGSTLQGRYILGAAMGEGGFGITYLAYDPVLQIRAAIKEYFPIERCTRDASQGTAVSLFAGVPQQVYLRGKEKFLREARILAKMDKQQVIVNVRDYFEENNTAYIVMEYIEGTTFTQLVRERGGRIPPEELFSLSEPLFEAIAELHDSGLIHRDICPDNLMLEKGRIRLLDFGCARETSCRKDTLTITLRHGYAPIEQYQQSGGQGPWTDIYALCATLYFCLTGVTPPVSTNRIVENHLTPPSALGVSLSPEQEKALLKGLQLQPHRRYRTVYALYRALYKTTPVPAQEQRTAGQATSVGPEGMEKDQPARYTGPDERKPVSGKPVNGKPVYKMKSQKERIASGGFNCMEITKKLPDRSVPAVLAVLIGFAVSRSLSGHRRRD